MIIKAIKSTLTLCPNEGQIKPISIHAAKRKAKYKYIQFAIQTETSKHLNIQTFPVKNWFKFTCFSVRTNNIKWWAETNFFR